jgi:hypothetical protein
MMGPLFGTLRLRSGQAVNSCPDTERKATADPSTSVVRRGGRPPLRMTSSGSGATARGWETLIPRFCRCIPRSAPGGTSCGAGGELARSCFTTTSDFPKTFPQWLKPAISPIPLRHATHPLGGCPGRALSKPGYETASRAVPEFTCPFEGSERWHFLEENATRQ